MSINSEAGNLLKGSEGESRINWLVLLSVAVGTAVVVYAGQFLWNYNGSLIIDPAEVKAQSALEAAQQQLEATATPTIAVYGMPQPASTAIIQQQVIERVIEQVQIPVEVTRIVTEYLTEYREIYIEADPIVHTEIVTVLVEAPVMPTVTPVPLAAGTLKVCASVEGATALYIGGLGVVSGGCQMFQFGVGQTEVLVQVNR